MIVPALLAFLAFSMTANRISHLATFRAKHAKFCADLSTTGVPYRKPDESRKD